MQSRLAHSARLSSIRPLVRYVDEDQAVIEINLSLCEPLPAHTKHHPSSCNHALQAMVEIDGDNGFHDEDIVPIDWHGRSSTVRFDLVKPRRWWPASMGEQALYDVTVRLLMDGQIVGEKQSCVGLTSVRRNAGKHSAQLTINGQDCPIQRVAAIDLKDENSLLPVSTDSLVIIRGHWGPDVLFDAADRAGMLLIQCVPLHAEGKPEMDVAAHVDRLAGHPSLAGWYVGHLGGITERLAYCIKSLDPTRHVFRTMPGAA